MVVKRNKRRAKCPRKRVQFGASTQTEYFVRSKQDIKESWYQKQDYKNFAQDRRNTVIELNRINYDLSSLDAEKYCVRGMEENMTPHQVFHRGSNARQCRKAVLHHQHYQRIMGISDPEQLRQASRLFSVRAMKRKVLLAVLSMAK